MYGRIMVFCPGGISLLETLLGFACMVYDINSKSTFCSGGLLRNHCTLGLRMNMHNRWSNCTACLIPSVYCNKIKYYLVVELDSSLFKGIARSQDQ